MHWIGEFEMSKTELAQIVAGNCNAAALMQFARAPFVAERGREWVIGDLRFPGQRGGGIADIDLNRDSPGLLLEAGPMDAAPRRIVAIALPATVTAAAARWTRTI